MKWNLKTPPAPPPPQKKKKKKIKDEAAQTPKRAIFPSLIWGKGGDSVETEERKSQPRFQGLSVHLREGKARYVHFQFQSPF